MIKYYCTEHTLDRRKPLTENMGLCQAAGLDGHCNMTAQFEIEEQDIIERVTGHTHQDRIIDREFIVGTFTSIPLNYNPRTGGQH